MSAPSDRVALEVSAHRRRQVQPGHLQLAIKARTTRMTGSMTSL
jgi:hypothetical protein